MEKRRKGQQSVVVQRRKGESKLDGPEGSSLPCAAHLFIGRDGPGLNALAADRLQKAARDWRCPIAD